MRPGSAGAVLVNSALLATLKTSFALTVWFSVVPVLLALCARRELWSRRAAVLGAGLLVATALFLTESRLARSDPGAPSFLAESLFTIHANLIARQMDADVAHGECAPYACGWLGEVAASLHVELVKSWENSRQYESFGFDPDYLFYHSPGIAAWPERFFAGDHEQLLAFYRHYYWRTVRRQPGAMAHKVATQLGLFYRWSGNPSFGRRSTLDLDRFYAGSAENLTRATTEEARAPIFARYLAELPRLAKTKAVIPQSLLVRVAKWCLALLYLPVLLGTVLVSLGILLRRTWRKALWPLAGATLLVFGYNFGNTLGTSVLHSMHIERYSEAQYAFALLAVGMGILFLAETGARVLRRAARVLSPAPPAPRLASPVRPAGAAA